MANLPNNIPSQSTSFVGRDSEIINIIELLKDPHCRLLSLIGPGGVGKTRLGIEVAEQIVQSMVGTDPITIFPDGVFLVALQSVVSDHNIIPEIANDIGMEFYDSRHQDKQLINYLNEKQLLLILDNFEHLLESCAVISALLSSLPLLKIMLTSRVPLNMREEWSFHVEGMAIPVSEETEGIDDYDAIRLFIERARRVHHNFSLNEEREYILRICQLVDGMPLAIELAAAWLRRISCAEIATEIHRNLDILETDMRDVSIRHRSMRAVFDYSWHLLDHEQHDVLMKLSVFQGGFRRKAAEKIAGASLRTLSVLVDNSLVVQRDGRYQIHELQRQYAAEHLAKTPDMETDVLDRHCAYYMAFMERPFRDFYGYHTKKTLGEIDVELDNVQTAWKWAVSQNRFHDLHRSIDGLYHYSFHRFWTQGVEQLFDEGLNALRHAETSPERDVSLGFLLANISSVAIWVGQSQRAIELAEESIAILEPLNAQRELAAAYVTRAWVSRFEPGRDPEEAKALMIKAASMLEETGQYELQGFMYSMLGGVCYDVGQYEESEYWDQKSLKLSRTIDDPRLMSSILGHLGRHALTFGQYSRAIEYLAESLDKAKSIENSSLTVTGLNRQGQVAAAMGDKTLAESCFRESVAIAKEWGKPYEIALSLINLAHVNVVQQEIEIATALYRESMKYVQNSRSLQVERLWGLGRIAFTQGDYSEARRLHEESLQLCVENNYRLEKVKNVDVLGQIALRQHLVSAATTNFKEALQESIAIGAPPVILGSLISLSELLAYKGDIAAAIVAAHFVVNQSASQPDCKERAARLLKRLEPDIATEKLADMTASSYSQDEVPIRAASFLESFTLSELSSPSIDTTPTQPLLDPLSARELELLQLVSAGKSNREIASELVLALGTVKSHLHNIYQKLNVRSRTQAIARAMELDLL